MAQEDEERLRAALRNALSKLESQIVRNPDLPEAYRDILKEGWAALHQSEMNRDSPMYAYIMRSD